MLLAKHIRQLLIGGGKRARELFGAPSGGVELRLCLLALWCAARRDWDSSTKPQDSSTLLILVSRPSLRDLSVSISSALRLSSLNFLARSCSLLGFLLRTLMGLVNASVERVASSVS